MKSKFLRKILAVSLCAALIGSTAASLPVFVPDSGITASAADTLTYGDFRYTVSDNDTITITRYNDSSEEVTIPSEIDGKSVTSIGDYAFWYCRSLTSITIPDSVTSIGDSSFDDCTSLTSIVVDSNNSIYSSVDGILYNKDKTELLCCPKDKKTANNIPSSVTSIGDNAFHGCSSLTSITIPDSVTSIGTSAFNGCAGLADNNGFIIVRERLYGYYGHDENITIPSGVTSIGDDVFWDRSSITSVTIPDSVTSIGKGAFQFCGLTSITIPDSVTIIGDYAFYSCFSLASVTIPNSVTSIGSRAFSDCSSLTSITIPDSVTSINDAAFSGCSSLTSITIQDSVTSIGKWAFTDCSSLTSITIPDSVTSIGSSAFSGCSSLTSITIPDSVTSIGGSAFRSCSSLTSITIPDSVTSINDDAFSGCSSLNSITTSGNLPLYSYLGSDIGQVKKVIIFDGTKNIGFQSFSNCYNLTSVTIPDSVTSIGERAFANCGSLTSITLPNSMTSIGSSAFSGCSNLTSVTIPDSVTSIEPYAFYNCSNLTSINIPPSVEWIYDNAVGYKGYHIEWEAYPEKIDGFTIYGKTGSAAETYAKDNGFTFVDDYALINNSEISSASVPVNTTVTLTGKAVKGTSPYTYAYYYKKSTDSTWTKIAGYSADTSKTFKPTTAGTYNVRVNVKDSAGETVKKDFTVKVKAEIPLTNKSSVSAESVTANTAVTLTGNADGGKAPYTYAYYYKKSTDSSWTKIAGYSADTSKTFKPTSAGTYTARVNVKDSAGTLVQKDFTVTVKAETTPLKNNSSVGATTVTAGTEVTLNGKAEGGTSPYKYAYYYKKSTDSTWTKAYVTSSGSAYTKYDSMKFTPKTAGTYTVRINVKDKYGEGTVVTKDFTVTVKAETTPLKNNSSVGATSVTAGTEVTMTGKATGGTSPYKYAYYYKKSTDSVWTKAYVTSSGSAYTKYDSVKFTPTTAGTYDVRINVRDEYGNGKTVTKDFKLTVK